jgi:hypothetical protein
VVVERIEVEALRTQTTASHGYGYVCLGGKKLLLHLNSWRCEASTIPAPYGKANGYEILPRISVSFLVPRSLMCSQSR